MMKRADALMAACPKCGAQPSAPCVGKRGPRIACHIERHPRAWDGRRAPSKNVRASRCNVLGWVYIIGHPNGDLVKIGWTGSEPEKRLAALQTANSAELFVLAKLRGTQRDERSLHREFAECRVRGEWFAVNDALDALIRRLAKELA